MVSANDLEIDIERDYTPFPVLWRASAHLRGMRAEETPGSHWAAMGALVMLAFAVECFCQTHAPGLVGHDEWVGTGGQGLERKAIREKLKRMGEKVDIKVNFGMKPWSDFARLLRARDSLAHAKPGRRRNAARIEIPDGTHPIDAAEHLVNEDWERLLAPAKAKEIADSVEKGLKEIWQAMGEKEVRLFMHGATTYLLQKRSEAP